METPKKLRRLARPDDWCCFSFDLQGAWVLPYMDDFLVLVSNKMEALRVRELASRILTRFGLGREKKGKWEPRSWWSTLGWSLEASSVRGALSVGVSGSASRKIISQRDPFCDFHQAGMGSEGEADAAGLERRRVVAQAAGAKPVERATDLAQSNKGEAAHRLLPVRMGRGPEPQARRKRVLAEWHRHTVDRFASELSAQLSRYYAQWYDTGCEGVDSLAYSWRGEVNWVNPPWSLLDEVAHKLREERVRVYWPIDNAWYSGTVGDTEDGLTHAYDDGDEERLDMSKERYKVLVVKPQVVAGWGAALHECWRVERGQSSHTELAVQMQSAALDSKTVGNYRPKAKAFIDFCDSEGCQWLPATEATVLLYIAHLLAKGTVRAASMQPYLSAINNYHEDMGFPGPAKGRGVSRAVKGMASMHVEAAAAAGEERTVSMLQKHISITDGTVSVALHKEKGRQHVRLKRRLTIPADGVRGLVQVLQHWEQLSSAIHSYIDPTAVPDEHMEKYSGWTTPRWQQRQWGPGTEQCA
ncbi:hypothetical protein CYMTET_3402 [Cymbomonas tetramitiformis]|uniref:Reverse transcriptase domain-containing protein n=1 Tax=Cymbomonas tetramitiformis TaxID=36881 RepID=A0AAE0LKW4_9CHLO|nr:hypothetical protein CYMTET_3402 [Cymbomonas tetramitiformis]